MSVEALATLAGVSPTIFRREGYRFYFFSREETRPHVHVQYAGGEAEFWIEPVVAVAQNHGLSPRRLVAALRLAREPQDEIRIAWKAHFGR